MDAVCLLLMVAQHIQFIHLDNRMSKPQQLQILWATQSKWCAPKDNSCRNKSPTQDPFVYNSGTTFPNNTDTQQRHQSSPAAMINSPACCGFCSCEPDCAEYGSCCLSEYRSLKYGKKMVEMAAAKYDCMRPQLMTTDELTDFTYVRGFETVWMVSRCPESSDDYKTKSRCENPRINGNLSSIAPLTDFITHYRNKYCARCNGVLDVDALLPWGLQLHCMQYFKLGRENILQRLVRHRCNIFFKPPRNVRQPRECIQYSGTISNCNVTGLWPRYNETIDLACNAYVDVFNATYKNVFCFLCNTNEGCDNCLANKTSCDDPRGSFIERTPLFSTMLNIGVLEGSGLNDKCGGSTYFNDEIMGVCHNIFCDPTRELTNQLCVLREKTEKPFCYVIYIKLTPNDATKFYVGNDRGIMHTRIKDLFGEDRSQVLVSNIYIKQHKLYWSAHFLVMEL